jgi:hypothetical protein
MAMVALVEAAIAPLRTGRLTRGERVSANTLTTRAPRPDSHSCASSHLSGDPSAPVTLHRIG